MTFNINFSPAITPSPIALRTIEGGFSTRTKEIVPTESILSLSSRIISEGFRNKTSRAIIIASYFPLLFLVDMVSQNDDYQGAAVWIICCFLTACLFNWTSWDNERPK